MTHRGFSLIPTARDEGTLWLSWLVRLRWVAISAQVITLAFVFNILDTWWFIPVWLGVVGALLLDNLIALRQLRQDAPIPSVTVLVHLVVDVLTLTAFFALGDGPANPFTNLYLVHVAMAAIMLPLRQAAAVTALTLACYGLISVVYAPLHLDQHALSEATLVHLGRALSQVISSVSVAVFVVGVASSLRRRREQLLQARERTARTDRLRAVGTLAAGAAHEINTPLSTMGLRLRRIRRRHQDEDTQRDVEVIQSQLDRCTSIVERLLYGAGDPSAADFEIRPLAEMVRGAINLWCKGSPIELRCTNDSEGLMVELPGIAFQHALINLLENAREAQVELGVDTPLTLHVGREGERGFVEIRDRGCGLPDQAEQVGEPFFTTKPTGTGLGVFVARAVADGAGGGLQYGAREGGGTVARWWFPEARRRAE